jgi:hypothetical protein
MIKKILSIFKKKEEEEIYGFIRIKKILFTRRKKFKNRPIVKLKLNI